MRFGIATFTSRAVALGVLHLQNQDSKNIVIYPISSLEIRFCWLSIGQEVHAGGLRISKMTCDQHQQALNFIIFSSENYEIYARCYAFPSTLS